MFSDVRKFPKGKAVPEISDQERITVGQVVFDKKGFKGIGVIRGNDLV